tara:strand:+ start:1136 stop:1303 length:168 start_codon:yes stop_codon:yes gene_type:complete
MAVPDKIREGVIARLFKKYSSPKKFLTKMAATKRTTLIKISWFVILKPLKKFPLL